MTTSRRPASPCRRCPRLARAEVAIGACRCSFRRGALELAKMGRRRHRNPHCRAGRSKRLFPGPIARIRLATGFVAHNVCSKTFVSGLDPQAAFAEFSDRAGIRRLRRVLRFRLDRTARTVDASTLGLFRSRAAFHDGLGCVELLGSKQPYLLKNDVEALKSEDAAAASRDCRSGIGRTIRSGVEERRSITPSRSPPRRRSADQGGGRGPRRQGDCRALCGRRRHRYAAARLFHDQVRGQRADRHPDAAGPGHALDAGADTGMARRRRSAARDRGRASDAHDHGPRPGRNQFRLRRIEPDVPGRTTCPPTP